jgi:hypothetical protein
VKECEDELLRASFVPVNTDFVCGESCELKYEKGTGKSSRRVVRITTKKRRPLKKKAKVDSFDTNIILCQESTFTYAHG